MGRFLRKLKEASRGATIIEFAIVCPTMLLLMMGLGELSYQGYLQSVLSGAVQKAARDSSIEGNGTSEATVKIDNKVKAIVGSLVKNATWDDSNRQNYAHFADVGPEYFFDSNSNAKYDADECFIDSNGNGTWDADPGVTGQGGANAVVVYQMGFTYPRIFPIAPLLGWSRNAHIQAETILKNQPYKFANTADNVKVCK